MIKKLKYCLLLLSFFAVSCGSYKQVPYFQDLKTSTSESITNFSSITVQPHDILGINVSSLNPESSAIFNTNLNRTNGNNYDTNPVNPVLGYLVDQDGNIEFPLVGEIKVSGLTTSQVQALILQKISSIEKEPTVTVRILNFQISVLGDVARPGVYPVTNERVTVTEALGLAGDLNITAVRTNILLVREIDGVRKYVTIDLTSKDLFTSPYYYLKNNDVIYVQPGKLKYQQVNRGGYEIGALLLSALTIIAIVFSTLHNK